MKINAKKILIYKGGTALGYQSNGTLSVSGDTIDVATKDSGGWGEVLLGNRSWELSVDGLMSYTGTDDTNGGQVLMDAFLNETLLSVSWETDTVGDVTYSGDVYVTSCELGGSNGEGATYSATLSGVGKITQGTKA